MWVLCGSNIIKGLYTGVFSLSFEVHAMRNKIFTLVALASTLSLGGCTLPQNMVMSNSWTTPKQEIEYVGRKDQSKITIYAYDIDGDGKVIDEAVILRGESIYSRPEDLLRDESKEKVRHLITAGRKKRDQMFETDLDKKMTSEEQHFLDTLYQFLKQKDDRK